MKKIILAAIICIAGTTLVKAQGSKGNLFLGTSIGSAVYNSINQSYVYPDGKYVKTNSKVYSIGISPSVGVYLSDHFIFGGSLSASVGHSNVNQVNTEDGGTSYDSHVTNSLFSIGPFARYYFGDKPSATMFYVEASGAIGTGSGSSSRTDVALGGASTPSSGNLSGLFSYNAGGSLGITHYVTKNIGLDISAGYLYGHETYHDNTAGVKRDFTNGNSGVAINAGFHLILP